MKFLYYDIIFLIIFCLSLVAFLIVKRKNIKRESKIFILYPTKVGLKFINSVGSKYKKFFKFMSYVVITTGYILMAVSVFLLIDLTIRLIKMPALFGVIKVPPIMPIFPYFTSVFKVDYLPPFYFTYWISAIAIIALTHEFSHGIFARFYGVRVKSTGFGFLGPFIAAFVEPDEKQLKRKKKSAQIAVLAAGSFANLIVTIIFSVVIAIFLKALFVPAGVIFDPHANGIYATGMINISDLTQIGKINASNLSVSEFYSLLNNSDKNYYDLKIDVDNESINLTKITTKDGKTYFGILDIMLLQSSALKKNTSNGDGIIVFDDSPALRLGLYGAISKINSVKISNIEDLKSELSKYKPYETISIEITSKDYSKKMYSITLAENPSNNTQGMLGIAFIPPDFSQGNGVTGIIVSYAKKIGEKLRDPNIFYEPRYNPSLIIFLYNFLWWITLLNISVALVNMMPLGIFDGGRVFDLTLLSVIKSNKKAAIISRIVKRAIILVFIILTIMWFLNI